MSNTKLNAITRQSALLSPERDNFWPIADQYIGLEVEMEKYANGQLDNHRMAGSPFWTEHADGSLRNGIEMVLAQPLMGTSLREAISYFFRTFTKYHITPRTSIHVHVNMRQDNETVEGVRNMIALYYMYEDAFFQIADQNRKWCAYCNAFEDTPPAILEAFMTTDMTPDALTDALNRSAQQNTNRYYGLNLNALSKFGTLEFRHFPLVTDEQRLIDWLKLIMELKAASNRMAEEGNTPWSVFITPDDIIKLHDYMPLYGQLLTSIVPISRAFHRMMSVRNLGLPRLRDARQEVVNNPAFKIFQEYQQKLGKKAKPKAKSIHQNLLDKLTAELEDLNRLGNAGVALTGAQLRRHAQLMRDVRTLHTAAREDTADVAEVRMVEPWVRHRPAPAVRPLPVAEMWEELVEENVPNNVAVQAAMHTLTAGDVFRINNTNNTGN